MTACEDAVPGASGRRSVYIARPPAEVYEFASDPRNLPRWAAGLAQPVTIHNPMRAVPNGEGSELVFTLIPSRACPTGSSPRTKRRSRGT
jgi:uncharacterized protein YndB with AHSA1/START domain